MIRHTILFKVKSDVSDSQIQKAMNNVLGLQTKLSGIVKMFASKCQFSENDVRDRGGKLFTHSTKNDIVNIVDGGYDGIIGFELTD